jgi:hypothetical protein
VTIANPQNRKEFKQYILTRLGAPVIEINLSDEQLDLCINEAFQYFHERQHYNGTEDVYLRVKMEDTFLNFFKTAETIPTENSSEPTVYAPGMVDKLVMISPGSGYPTTQSPSSTKIIQKTKIFELVGGGTNPNTKDIQFTEAEGLTVNWGEERTSEGGLVDVQVYNTGTKYKVGDWIIIEGGNNDAIFEVKEIKSSSPMHGYSIWEHQRNYIIMPRDVVGVYEILQVEKSQAGILGGFPAAMLNPFLIGGVGGDAACGGMSFDLVSYYTMKQWLSDLNFMTRNQINFDFNQRTHRLFINSKSGMPGSGSYMVVHCAMKPSPDIFPDLWDDLFMKKYTVALAKMAYGQNLTKYQNVQLPGGITMNGEMIYSEGKEERNKLEERFAMDWADPVLDMVG